MKEGKTEIASSHIMKQFVWENIQAKIVLYNKNRAKNEKVDRILRRLTKEEKYFYVIFFLWLKGTKIFQYAVY